MTPIVGAPWWANLLTLALVAIVVAWINRPVRKALRRIRDQTENEHHDADYPNLRDELTATREAAEKAVDAAERAVELAEALAAGQKRHDAEIGGLRADIRGCRDDTRAVADRLDGLGQETRREHTATARRLDAHLEDARERDDRLDERLARIEHQQH